VFVHVLSSDGGRPSTVTHPVRFIRLDAHGSASHSIGRTSKDDRKQLLAAPDNLLFDNPVMSRKHATLTFAESPEVNWITRT